MWLRIKYKEFYNGINSKSDIKQLSVSCAEQSSGSSSSLPERPQWQQQGALEVSITSTHRPPGTQANVSPLDYSSICLMDVFWAERCATDRSPVSGCSSEEREALLLEVHYTSTPLLIPIPPPNPFILPSFSILRLFVCVCICIHACSHVLVTGLHWEADCNPEAMPEFLQSTLLPSFGLMNG